MRKRRKGSIFRTLIGTIAIIFGIIVCSVGSIAAVDMYCRSEINKWMPIYPDAELVEEIEWGFFRPRASGITEQVYRTDDSDVDVRAWYREYRRELTSDQVNESNPDTALTSAIATVDFVIRDDDESEGSLIFYYSECAYN